MLEQATISPPRAALPESSALLARPGQRTDHARSDSPQTFLTLRHSFTVRLLASAVLAALLALPASDAHAFPTSSFVSQPCHENITMEALRAARIERPAARPLAAVTRDDDAFIDDLPFDIDGDMRDLGAAALLTGVRFNDLKGRGPNEVDQLAQIHGDPGTQHEHCLRAPTADQPSGSETALRDCRAFIRDKIRDALGGLDGAGNPDVAARITMKVDLSLRGGVDAPLPRYYARMGEALHAVQDGFTHTYRAGDRTKVTVVLNYIELVGKDLVPARDGPGHSSELDRCDNPDDLRALNRTLAVQSSFELLRVSLDTALSTSQKMAAVEVILDKYFSYQAGCDESNGWCNAPETQYADSEGCGCSVVGGGQGGSWWLLVAGLPVALAFARRWKRSGKRRTAKDVAAILGVLALTFALPPRVALAQSTDPAAPPATDAPAAPPSEPAYHALTPEEAKAAQKEEAHHESAFGIYAAGAGSISSPGVAGMFGLRLRLNKNWVIGLDGEMNGWYGVHSGEMRTGSANIYGSIIVRFPLRFEQVNLRSTLQLGTAIQMVELFGVPKGSVGIFAGLNPLGIEWKLSGHLYAILYPIGIALPVTQLKGAPFSYPQYRTTLGLELSF
jgi:hypothetical protein